MFIIGILLSLIQPILALFLCLGVIMLSRKVKWQWMLLTSLLLALPTLLFMPDSNMDANSYFLAMDFFKGYPDFDSLFRFISSTTTDLGEYKSYPGTLGLMYVVSKTNLYTILSFISVTLAYFSSMLAVSIFYLNKRSYGYFFIQIVSLFCIHYLFSMSVIRYYLAASLLLMLAFGETKVKNKSYKLLYLIPISIHPGIIPPVVIIFFGQFIKRISNKLMMTLLVTIPVLFSLGTVIQKVSGGNYIGIQMNKLLRYVDNGELVTKFITTKTILIEAIVILYLIIFIIIVNINKSKLEHLDNNYRNINSIAYYFAAFTIGLAPFNIIFIRYMTIVIPLTLASFSIILSQKNIRFRNIIFFNLLLLIVFGVLSNLDIQSISFIRTPLKTMTTPLLETLKFITRY
ncbi:hypothetical protein LABALGNA3A7_05770 [Dellaglioa algida]|nr:hypothetical protein LABALGNA3A7_05770 [Dellaglioa algida]